MLKANILFKNRNWDSNTYYLLFIISYELITYDYSKRLIKINYVTTV